MSGEKQKNPNTTLSPMNLVGDEEEGDFRERPAFKKESSNRKVFYRLKILGQLITSILLLYKYSVSLNSQLGAPYYLGYGNYTVSGDTFSPPSISIWITLADLSKDEQAILTSGNNLYMPGTGKYCKALDGTSSARNKRMEYVNLKLDWYETDQPINNKFSQIVTVLGLLLTVVALFVSAGVRYYYDKDRTKDWSNFDKYCLSFVEMLIPYMTSMYIVFLSSFKTDDGICVYSIPATAFSAHGLAVMAVVFLWMPIVALFLFGFETCCRCKKFLLTLGFIAAQFIVQALMGLIISTYQTLDVAMPQLVYCLLAIVDLVQRHC